VFTEGTLENTGNPLDVAITGDGFFQITFTDGSLRYTRDGAFRLNAAGNIVNADGFLLTPTLTIPANTRSINISPDGTVTALVGNATAPTTVGQMQLALFANPAGLSSEGRNLFAETTASGTPVLSTPGTGGAGLVQQGFLELSNVDVVNELINLILAQRAYEFNTRSVRVADEMLAATVELVR
jgi:flagellar basal-body rod protein FlgG